MSRLPCPPQHIAQVPEADRDKCEPYTTLPALCRVRTCGLQATEEHHVVPKHFTRSWKERDYAVLYGQIEAIKVPLCSKHHRDCTENRSWFEYVPGKGFAFWTELMERITDNAPSVCDQCGGEQPGCPCQLESGLTEGEAMPDPGVGTALRPSQLAEAPSVSPGQSCPACHRRIPYPKVETSPTSAVWSMRLPADAKEDFKGIVDALADHLGAGEEPYGRYKAVLTAAVYALQVAPEKVLPEIGGRVS